MNNPNYAQDTPAGHPDTAPAAREQFGTMARSVLCITNALKQQFGEEISSLTIPQPQTREANVDDGADTSAPEQLAA